MPLWRICKAWALPRGRRPSRRWPRGDASMGILNGIVTFIALVTFIGIVWWAYSRGRSKANADASMLPFALPDEEPVNEQACAHDLKDKTRSEERRGGEEWDRT